MQIHGNNIYKQKIHLLIAVKVQDKLQKYVVPFYAVCDGAGCPVDIRLAQTRELARRLKMNKCKVRRES